ncbi:MAG: sugar phosphate isomerase/epimerase [Clostridia bacterium]|jgi:sugar phosphate isomerase/epimerase|nr:sugar phosphate isomerase/epimerase [Clostridia bacterium]
MERAAAVMQANGFTLFYHNHQFEFYKYDGERTVFDLLWQNAPHLHFIFDTYWAQYGGCDPARYIERLAVRVECVHLKDYAVRFTAPETCEPCFAPVGSGTLDFPAIVRAAEKAGARYFFVEQDNASDLPDPFAPVEKSIRYIRASL